MRKIISSIAMACLAASLISCSVNPVTGEKEFTMISASQEVALGEEKYELYQQQQGGRYTVDPELNLYVNRVGQQLAQVSQRPDLPYEFVVLNNSAPNAWALPGGKIAINRGLLTVLDDEAQLAAVLGHEIVHAAARHSARQMTQAMLLNVGLQATGILAAKQSEYGQFIMAGAGLGANLWQARYGREQELEADRYGTQYLSSAGYDAEAAVELQEKFVELSQGSQKSWMDNLFASHPPSQERVKLNEKLASQMPGGDRNAQTFQRAVAQIKKDQPAYDAHTEAVAAASNGDFGKAMTLIDKAIKQQPEEALFHITRGQLLMSQDRNGPAVTAFERARSLNPEYYMSHLGLGLLLKETGKTQPAREALQKSMDLLPTTLAGYHLGELALAAGDTKSAINYFEYAAQGEGDIAKAAQAQLNKLVPQAATSPSS